MPTVVSTAWKILVLAAKEGDLKPLRHEFEEVRPMVEWTLCRNLAEVVHTLDTREVDAAILTPSVSHLHLAQSLAGIRARDAHLPVILVVHAGDAGPVVKAVSSGVSSVVLAEALVLLPGTVEREIRHARAHRELQRRCDQTKHVAAAAENAPVALAYADPDGIVRWANEAYRRLAQTTPDSVAAGECSIWSGSGPEPEAWAALRSGRVWRSSVPARCEGGEALLHQVLVATAGAEPGTPPWFVVVRHEPAEAEAADIAGELAAQRGELFAAIAGGIAHDLNNILAPITMAANLLREQNPDFGDISLVETIENSAERGAAVIKQVLAFAHGSENCAMPLQPRLLVREVARLAAEIFPGNIGVRADLPGELWTIVGDPGEIQQAIVNVLVNARDALSDGGHVAVTARNTRVRTVADSPFFDARPGEYVEIVVEDDGPGMDPQMAARAWEPFVTTKGSGQGAGLGLSRVAGVLRSHGGFATLQSRPGHGTAVRLFFPRAVVEAVCAPSTAEPAPRACGRILVVDDEDSILDLSRRVLERAGHEVLVASEGREALALFARHRSEIGLVITDLAMPGMNGFTLIWALRRSKPDLRVMVATGQGTEANLRELERMGVRQVLLKPFGSRRLHEAVAQTLAEPAVCEPDLFLGEVVVNGH